MIKIELAKNPLAVLDADAVTYIAAHRCQLTGDIILKNGKSIKGVAYLRQEIGYRIIDNYIHKIETGLDTTNVECYLSNNDPSTNYRYEVLGAVKDYKANRKAKPFFLPHMRSYFTNNYWATVCDRGEADDSIGMLSYESYEKASATGEPINVVICGIDKDFKQFPGYFFNIRTGETTYSDHFGFLSYDKKKGVDGRGFLFFCAQMIMGDTSDNIVGIYGCGDKKAYDTLKDCNEYSEAWCAVVDLYRDKGIDDSVIEAHAALLWITHKGGKLLPHHYDIKCLV